MKIIKALAAFAVLTCGLVAPSFAEVVVIVNPANKNTLTDREVRKVYLGKTKAFPDGSKIDAYEMSVGSSAREEFLEKVLKKDEATLNSHWARMLFSSKAQPPIPVGSTAEMKRKVTSDPNAIGYIDAADVDGSVKVLLRIN